MKLFLGRRGSSAGSKTTVFIKMLLCSKTRQEGNVLFNDTLNTFYLRLYGRRTYGKGPLG